MKRMPAQDSSRPSLALKKLRRVLSVTQTSFSQQYPVAAAYLAEKKLDPTQFKERAMRESQEPQAPGGNTFDLSIIHELQAEPKALHDPLVSHLSHEEFVAIVEKLQTVLHQPPGHIETESQLYLEQQLSDLLGIPVSGTLDGYQLPFHTGVIEAEPHRKRFPDDQLRLHQQYPEAGIREARSFFGWFITQNTLTDQAEQRERYTISVPLPLLPDWSTKSDALKPWYKYRKVIAINPFDARAVVACIGDLKLSQTLKYQFGGSPEVMREGLFWSPASHGRVCVLFVDDPSDRVPLGPMRLTAPNL